MLMHAAVAASQNESKSVRTNCKSLFCHDELGTEGFSLLVEWLECNERQADTSTNTFCAVVNRKRTREEHGLTVRKAVQSDTHLSPNDGRFQTRDARVF
jgi:hypothetical protein